MRKLFRNFLMDERGGPAMEFALVATLTAFCIPAVVDIAMLIDRSMKLSGGIRGGQQYALRYSNDNTGIANAIANASNLPASRITVTTTQFCECSGIATTCGTVCSGGVPPSRFVNVTAAYDMSEDYIYNSLPYPPSFSRTIAVRIQ